MEEQGQQADKGGIHKNGKAKGVWFLVILAVALFLIFSLGDTRSYFARLDYPTYRSHYENDGRHVEIEGVEYYEYLDDDYNPDYELSHCELDYENGILIVTDEFDCYSNFFEGDDEKRWIISRPHSPLFRDNEIKYHSRLYIREGYTFEDFIEFVEESEAVAP